MRCQGESCQEVVVAHITEVVSDVATEFHLCQRHYDDYLAQNSRLQEQLREACAARGGARGPGLTAEAVPSLVKWAVDFLGCLNKEDAVPRLIGLLEEEQPAIRWVAVMTLAKIARGSTEAAAALRRTLQDSDEEVRAAAVWALSRVEQ